MSHFWLVIAKFAVEVSLYTRTHLLSNKLIFNYVDSPNPLSANPTKCSNTLK